MSGNERDRAIAPPQRPRRGIRQIEIVAPLFSPTEYCLQWRVNRHAEARRVALNGEGMRNERKHNGPDPHPGKKC
jgi:hypothetical protein